MCSLSAAPQAFEEKFDLFLVSSSQSNSAESVEQQRDVPDVANLSEATLVRSPRHSYTGAWYVSEPKSCAGLAAFKTFGKEGSSDAYTFELIGVGNPSTTTRTFSSVPSRTARVSRSSD